jgi:hypothetical protein
MRLTSISSNREDATPLSSAGDNAGVLSSCLCGFSTAIRRSHCRSTGMCCQCISHTQHSLIRVSHEKLASRPPHMLLPACPSHQTAADSLLLG